MNFCNKKNNTSVSKDKIRITKSFIFRKSECKRDWGHAKDFVEAQWLILQQKKPEDFVIATGKQYSVREFVNLAAKNLNMKIEWKGKNEKEVGIFKNKEIIKVDKKYYRPSEVHTLLGDSSKARRKLKWKPKISFEELVKEMVEKDLKSLSV